MPFALLIIGIVLITSAVRNTSDQLFALIKGDFSGDHNFLYWMVLILILGALGYIDALRPLSRIFMVLVIVVLFLSNGGFFQKFNQQLFGTSITGA